MQFYFGGFAGQAEGERARESLQQAGGALPLVPPRSASPTALRTAAMLDAADGVIDGARGPMALMLDGDGICGVCGLSISRVMPFYGMGSRNQASVFVPVGGLPQGGLDPACRGRNFLYLHKGEENFLAHLFGSPSGPWVGGCL